MEKYQDITEEAIEELVDRFYTKVRDDEKLSPVFFNAIGTSKKNWLPHLLQICRFWSSIMLHTGRYSGHPLDVHKALPHFEENLFDRWLSLFVETLHEIYTEDIANLYHDRALKMANSFRKALYHQDQ